MENQQLPVVEAQSTNEPVSEQPPIGTKQSGPSNRIVPAILLAALVGGLGAVLGLISMVERVPEPYLVPIWVSQSANDSAGIHGPILNDYHAITSGRLFANVDPKATNNPTRSLILDQLESLKSRSQNESVVIYISAFAALDEKGDAFLVPHDVDSANPANRLYLEKLLGILKQSKSNQKLLVLDVSWPFTIPEFEMFDDNVAGEIEKNLIVNGDPNLLCINSCSPGQTAWTMLAPRRSAFGFFFEQGLQGGADGFSNGTRDGRVSVLELAGYLSAQVDDYSSRVCPARQTPVLLGNGDDFSLVAYSNNSVLEETAATSRDTEFPQWLAAAWQARDEVVASGAWKASPEFVREFENTILQFEMNWRRGGNSEEICSNLENELNLLAREFNQAIEILCQSNHTESDDDGAGHQADLHVMVPHLTAIAQASAKKKTDAIKAASEKGDTGSQPTDTEETAYAKTASKQASTPSNPQPQSHSHVASKTDVAIAVGPEQMFGQLSELFADLTVKQQITPAANWPAAKAKLIEKFEGETKQIGNDDFVDGIFLFAAKAPDLLPSQLMILTTLQSKRGLANVKSAVMAELARHLTATEAQASSQFWNMNQVQRTLSLIASSEDSFEDIQTWDWLGQLKSSADDERYVIESVFWHPGFVDSNEFDSRLQNATANFTTLLALAKRAEDSYRSIDFALWRLPQLARYGDLYSESLSLPRSDRWKRAADFADNLQTTLNQNTTDSELVQLTEHLKLANIDAIELDSQLQNLLRRYSPNEVSDLVHDSQNPDASLVCLVQLQENLATPFADSETRVRVHQASLKLANEHHLKALDANRETSHSEFNRLSKEDLLRANENSQSRTRKRQLVYKELNRILKRPNQTELSGWHRFKVSAMEAELKSARSYWSHLALKYEKLAEGSPLATTYQGLAQRYRGLSNNSSRPSLSVEVVSTDNEISPLQRNSTHEVAFHRSSHQPQNGQPKFSVASHAKRTLQAKSGSDNLQVNVLPTSSRAVAVDATLKANQRRLELDIQLDNQAKQIDFANTKGFFIEFIEDGNRFLHRVDLPGLSKEKPVELFVGANSSSLAASDAPIRLRPSKERQSTALFVKNLTNIERELDVTVNAFAGKLKLKPNQTRRVVLAGKPPKPGEPLPPIPNGLAVEVRDAQSEAVLLKETIDVVVAAPREYVEIVSSRFTPFAGGRNRLEVTLRASKQIVGPPCTVELILNPAKIPGLRDVEGGKLHSTLPRDGKPMTLYAENLRLEEMPSELGRFEVSVDGEPRTFVFDATFARQGTSTTPKLISSPAIEIEVGRFGLAGPNFPIALKTINAPVGSRITLQLARQDSQSHPDRSLSLPSARQTQIGFSPDGSGGLLFSAEIEDWLPKLDTSGLVGTRQINVQMTLDDSVVSKNTQTVSLDNRPPSFVRFENVPQRVAVGTDQMVKVIAVSDTTGISSVDVFIGKLENGKLPEKVELLACLPVDSQLQNDRGSTENQSWASLLKIPKVAGDINITAVATNGAGLKTFETQALEIVPADALDFGSIKGQVFESVRAQPGLEVLLRDLQGNVIAKTKTSVFGMFEFASVRSGNYVVESNKPSAGRAGGIRLKVVAGQTSGGDISLELR
ncbi:MAG: carboxypeptidase-like regulatory domain-containing protein [Mariniblastus sp.]